MTIYFKATGVLSTDKRKIQGEVGLKSPATPPRAHTDDTK